MVLEIAQFDIKPGAEAAFEAGVAEGAALFRDAKGCRSFRLERGVEAPGRYRLLIEWDEVDNHLVDFRQSTAAPRWRELISGHFATPPQVDHSTTILSETFRPA